MGVGSIVLLFWERSLENPEADDLTIKLLVQADDLTIKLLVQADDLTIKLLVQLETLITDVYLSRDVRKPVFGVSDQVRHKPACTSSEKS